MGTSKKKNVRCKEGQKIEEENKKSDKRGTLTMYPNGRAEALLFMISSYWAPGVYLLITDGCWLLFAILRKTHILFPEYMIESMLRVLPKKVSNNIRRKATGLLFSIDI